MEPIKKLILKSEFCKRLKKLEIGKSIKFLYSVDLFEFEIHKKEEDAYLFQIDAAPILFKKRFYPFSDSKNIFKLENIRLFMNFSKNIYEIEYPEKIYDKRAVCLLLLDEYNKVLTVSRKKTKLLGLPGGKIDGNEAQIEALIREVKEETNLDLTSLNGEFQLIYCSYVDGFLCWCYTIVDKKGKPYKLQDEDLDCLKQLEEGVIPSMENIKYLSESKYSEFYEYNNNAIKSFDRFYKN